MKKFFRDLNFLSQCKKYRIPFWQCPQFLFLILGIFIIFSIILTYSVGVHYIEDPISIILIVFGLTIVLLILEFSIVRSFERLMELTRLKSEFIEIVSHHLRTPLSNLSWALELLSSGKIEKNEKTWQEYLEILKENTQRMAELVSNLLIVSRLETATVPPQKQEFSLAELVRSSIKKFEEKIKGKEIEILFEKKEKLPKAFADPSQIRLTIEALLDNSIRYIQGKGKVEIKIEQKGKNLYFEIKDNGVGIPKEDQKYIFQKFFRSQNVLRLQTQGLGLGLFIAKTIIENSGGKIGFISEENKGSTFWFTLPIK